MSSCRCDDIQRCRAEIDELNSAQSTLGSCGRRFDSISGKLSSLALYSKLAYDTPNMTELFETIKNLDNDMVAVRDAYGERLSSKIHELWSDLEDMQSEDDDYHEEEEAAAEAAAAAALAEQQARLGR